jgi:hypothetical protein
MRLSATSALMSMVIIMGRNASGSRSRLNSASEVYAAAADRQHAAVLTSSAA